MAVKLPPKKASSTSLSEADMVCRWFSITAIIAADRYLLLSGNRPLLQNMQVKGAAEVRHKYRYIDMFHYLFNLIYTQAV
jgi:hypothetical protein